MKTKIAVFAAIVCCAVDPAYALYKVEDRGAWPTTWPEELEPLRKQARTFVGPTVLLRRYLIPFTKREEFEAAWPHFLAVKTKGAPIVLVRGPKTDFFPVSPAGILIHAPPLDAETKPDDEVPLEDAKKADGEWRTRATYLVLVVDGEIVDLNRLRLPPDTLIIDERFKK